jgi:uncharacterized iron-regulated membrane protein
VKLPLRKAVFWTHLAMGIAVAGVVLMMSVTGVILTYETQLTRWVDRAAWAPPAAPGDRVPLSEIVATAQATRPETPVSSIVLHGGPNGPVEASFGRAGGAVYLDPSTGKIRGETHAGLDAFFSGTRRWHRWFNLDGDQRSIGTFLTGWSNLIFFFLVLSGLYLWFPRRWAWQYVRAVLLLKPLARGKVRDFNWHHVWGFWLALPLAVVVLTGVALSFPEARNVAFAAVGAEVTARQSRGGHSHGGGGQEVGVAQGAGGGGDASSPAGRGNRGSARGGGFEPVALDPVGARVVDRLEGWERISIRFPRSASAPLEAQVELGGRGEATKRYTLTYDAETGEETAFEGFGDQDRASQLRAFVRFGHTGQFFGFWGQTLAGLASLAGVILVWTGLALSWRRMAAWLRRRRRVAPDGQDGAPAADKAPRKAAEAA